MGLFGKLKDAVGIGSLRADIQLTAPGYHPGDVISGKVVLSGAASETKVTSVLVQLVQFGTDVEITEIVTEDYYYGPQYETYEKQFKYNTIVFEQYLAQDFAVAPGQRLELPFDISTPPEMSPSDNYNRWVLKAHADLPGMMDARAVKPIHVMVGGAMPMESFGGPPVEQGSDLPSPGERILGFYEDAWYECTVVSVSPTGVHVNWDDGTTSTVALDGILPSESALPGPGDIAPGQRVMARYEEAFYEATVATTGPNQVALQWDDGSQSWVAIHDIRLL